VVHRLEAPVVEVRDGGNATWLFLCEPRRCGQPVPMLAHHGVEFFDDEAQVPLPSSVALQVGSPRWVVRPKVAAVPFLPPWMAVFSCVRKAIHR
jgi:hypothetical protein